MLPRIMQKMATDTLREALHSEALVHAYGIEGDVLVNTERVRSLLETEQGLVLRNNPDAHFLSYNNMGVDDVRALVGSALLKPFSGSHAFFIISAISLTREAQNALLKLFEEPTEGTHFFLITPSFKNLLPTLQSRLFLLREASSVAPRSGGEAFLHADPKERLTFLTSLIEKKDKEGALRFLNDLEVYFHHLLEKPENISEDVTRALHDIEMVRTYLSDRAPSLKMLLEYLALSLPKIHE